MGLKPGMTNNRKGRPPKSQAFTELLREFGERKPTAKSKRTNKEAVVAKLYALAKSGDREAIKYLMDRIDGKPKQSVEADITKRELPDIITIEEYKDDENRDEPETESDALQLQLPLQGDEGR